MDNPRAKSPYAMARAVILWNGESCKIPRGITASDILPRVQTSLVELGYVGPLEMSAVVANENSFSPGETASLLNSGIKIVNSGEGNEEFVDLMIVDIMLKDMVHLCKAPANVLIISGDGDGPLSHYLVQLKRIDYNVMYAFGPEAVAPTRQIPTTWEWLKLLKL